MQTDSANLLSDNVEKDLCSAESISVRGIVELPILLGVPSASSNENNAGMIQDDVRYWFVYVQISKNCGYIENLKLSVKTLSSFCL